MKRYIIMRLLYTVVVILGVSILVFIITHVIGNPVNTMLPLQATDAERAALKHQLGLDKPLMVQLSEFLSGMFRLDFGKSWWQQVPALGIVLHKIPATLQLVATALIIAVMVAIPLGIIAAYKPGTILDRVLTTASLIGICLPPFWVGLMFVLFFAVKLGWFYTSGYGTIRHLILPALTLAVVPMGHLAQIVRFSMAEQLNAQYSTTARAKGASDFSVLFAHALKNAATSIVTMGGMDLGRLLAGETAAVEVVFGWPGFGTLIVDTIGRQDFPLLQAEVFLVAVIICFINLAVDISYGYFDPRIRY
ncbi:ABC transporter permease [Biomaibacter acetigenes]|uniref:ABC transporter permease n=1 Tax=Biomaibacter acetigenes TaxID=2316383 RepID=A0A3G2R8T7_9FIRM|nr:ABC transporter permease [Biomaibacter acetigenes]AYO31856.1 ABC transporter permease [Biomaibacter acetigenes]